MNIGNIIRFGFILCLWMVLVWLLITRTAKVNAMTVFTIVASGIIVFVPLYKKYIRK